VNREIEATLAAEGIELTPPPTPRYDYVTFTRAGDIAYFSGKTPLVKGVLAQTGRVGDAVSVDQASAAARVCMINLMSAIEFGVGLEHVQRILKLTGYVASAPDFFDQALVVNAASRLLVDVLGETGTHARTAVGVAALPGNASVELDLVVQLTQPDKSADR
jgi:enamine deaminase RidA (YjgF/YER057c/UK114 family)